MVAYFCWIWFQESASESVPTYVVGEWSKLILWLAKITILSRTIACDRYNRFASLQGLEAARPELHWSIDDSAEIVKNVFSMLCSLVDISTPELVLPLVALICRILPNKCISFSVLYDILQRPEWFIRPSLFWHRVRLNVFRQIVRSTIPKTCDSLEELQLLDEKHLNEIFVFFFTNCFPLDQSKRVVSSRQQIMIFLFYPLKN